MKNDKLPLKVSFNAKKSNGNCGHILLREHESR